VLGKHDESCRKPETKEKPGIVYAVNLRSGGERRGEGPSDEETKKERNRQTMGLDKKKTKGRKIRALPKGEEAAEQTKSKVRGDPQEIRDV